jgi:hypothetical protein
LRVELVDKVDPAVEVELFLVLVEEELVETLEDAEEGTLFESDEEDVEDPSLVEDEVVVFEETSTHNATRKNIKNFKNMMKIRLRSLVAV